MPSPTSGHSSAAFTVLLGEERAAAVFSDPPYNVPIDGHASGLGAIHHRPFPMASGEMNRSEFTAFLTQACGNLAAFSADGSLHYLCMDWRHLDEMLAAGRQAYGALKNLCVWAKDNAGMGAFYRSQHELILVFKHGGSGHRNNVQLGRFGRNRSNVWHYPGVNSTHQYDTTVNPYSGSTGDDCEFYRITMNADHSLNFVGPVTEDSLSWAQSRFSAAQQLYTNAGFPMPQFMTFPSYAASVVDYQAANGFFTAASERRLYPTGLLSGQPYNYGQVAGQYMPYTVKDVYGMKVLADTLGGIEPLPYFSYPARLPADIIADAQRNLVVRDGWASFFYHTYDNITYLQQTVTGLKNLGYTFVSPTAA